LGVDPGDIGKVESWDGKNPTDDDPDKMVEDIFPDLGEAIKDIVMKQAGLLGCVRRN
jgi:hypothetical protein